MAYSPAGVVSTDTTNLQHLIAAYYKRKGLDRLQKKFVFRAAAVPDVLPKANGKTVQWYRYTNPAAVTTTKTEGVVGSSQVVTSNRLQATVSQYAAFITVSDLLRDTCIDPIIQSCAELLGYQAGLSVDTITRTVLDDEAANVAQTLIGANLQAADFRKARHALQGVDVQPMEDGNFYAIAHPYVTFDLVNDPTAMGLADIYKFTNPRGTSLISYEDRGTVAYVGGCKIVESTNVNYDTGTPGEYRVYILGKGAFGTVDLEGRGPSNVRDPRNQRFAINVIKGEPSIADPEGVIGGAVSYNFVFVAAVLEGPVATIGGTYRFKTIDVTSTIAN